MSDTDNKPTENGWSDDGQLNDVGRIEYLRGHLQAVLDAILRDRCNVVGHTTWRPDPTSHLPTIRLIDFGCAIDMNFFEDKTQFKKRIETVITLSIVVKKGDCLKVFV